MAKGGSSGGTTISKTEPWDEAKPYFESLYKAAEDAYGATNKTAYAGGLVTRPNENNLAAQSMLAQFIPGGAASWAPSGQQQGRLQGSRVSRPRMQIPPALAAFLAQHRGQ